MKTACVFFASAAVAAAAEAVTTISDPVATGAPLVDSNILQRHVTEEELLRHANALQDIAYATEGRNRVFGSEGHKDTVDYILEQLGDVAHYYDIQVQEFDALFSDGNASLRVVSPSAPTGTEIETMMYSFSPPGNISAEVVVIPGLGCNATDYPTSVSGKIALISRGDCPFGQKSALAGTAGAAGAIIYNNQPDAVAAGTLGAPPNPFGPYVPTTGAKQEDGLAMIEAINGGAVITAEIDLWSISENRTTENIIIQSRGGDQNRIIFAGAHSDSVIAGPGINDNGSGSIGILTVAKALAQYSVNHAVRFAWFSAEEFGLLGSEHYVSTLPEPERAKIALYLNFDMIASPNFIYGIYDGDGNAHGTAGPPGSAQAEQLFEEFFELTGVNSTATAFTGRSDYGPFLEVGIPAGGLFTGAEVNKTEEEAAAFGGLAGVAYDANYHKVGDTVDNLNFEAFFVNTKAIAYSVAEYARDLSSIPTRTTPVAPRVKRSVAEGAKHPVSHGHDHGGACERAVQ